MFSGACNSCAISVINDKKNLKKKKRVMSLCKNDFSSVTIDHIIKLWQIV